jgi:hypothetical protein
VYLNQPFVAALCAGSNEYPSIDRSAWSKISAPDRSVSCALLPRSPEGLHHCSHIGFFSPDTVKMGAGDKPSGPQRAREEEAEMEEGKAKLVASSSLSYSGARLVEPEATNSELGIKRTGLGPRESSVRCAVSVDPSHPGDRNLEAKQATFPRGKAPSVTDVKEKRIGSAGHQRYFGLLSFEIILSTVEDISVP